ncbi:hypothetical protein Leucomu_05700 [Leucobacter muris]|uniref:Head-to-tail stopper n=1 Tax=Leucobacter muris TaxID=1935379 RepID=A0ABX5QEI8_9MICO|nr:hypothetical protein [Leucobacter muris]QAB17482.1 hypothetical protein Leucomu_05700 [Leucobacter muris]
MALVKRKISEYITRYPYQGGGEDSQGNEIEGFGPGQQLGIYAFDPGGRSESSEPGRDAVVTEPTIYLPPGSPFAPHDECVVRGKRYAVEGEPADWVHPTRGPKCDVIRLRRADG